MNVAVFSIVLFSAVFVLHVAIWRVQLPKSHTRALLLLFVGALPLALVANVLLPWAWSWRLHGFWQHAHAGLLHVALSLAYIEFYTVIEEDSPSLTLLLFVERAGRGGRSEDEMYQVITDEFVMGGRLRSLVNGGLVSKDESVYRLTSLCRAWAGVFQFARRLYHLQLGG